MKATIKTDKITKAAIRINVLSKEVEIDSKDLIKLSKVQFICANLVKNWSKSRI